MKRVDILIKAYVNLLRLSPNDHWRLINQRIYASVRDTIAEDLKIDSEHVQVMAEALARAKCK